MPDQECKHRRTEELQTFFCKAREPLQIFLTTPYKPRQKAKSPAIQEQPGFLKVGCHSTLNFHPGAVNRQIRLTSARVGLRATKARGITKHFKI